MRITHDSGSDEVRVVLREAPNGAMKEVAPGVRVAYGQDGRLAGVTVRGVSGLTDGPAEVTLELPDKRVRLSAGWRAAIAGVLLIAIASVAVIVGGTRVNSGVAKTGSVLLADDMSDPAEGKLPQSSDRPTDFTQAYANGAYVVTTYGQTTFDKRPTANVTFPHEVDAPLPGRYADVTIAVDAELAEPRNDQYVDVACRAQDPTSTYHLTLAPASGAFQIIRWKGGVPESLTGNRHSAAIHLGSAPNHLELRCKGPALSASINGESVASANDDTFAEGGLALGVGQAPPGVFPPPATALGGKIEARFRGLLVTQQ
jgi:hypothetical protein